MALCSTRKEGRDRVSHDIILIRRHVPSQAGPVTCGPLCSPQKEGSTLSITQRQSAAALNLPICDRLAAKKIREEYAGSAKKLTSHVLIQYILYILVYPRILVNHYQFANNQKLHEVLFNNGSITSKELEGIGIGNWNFEDGIKSYFSCSAKRRGNLLVSK